MLCFDSALYHMTDARLRFRRGYLHRRINFTLLFGRRFSAPFRELRSLWRRGLLPGSPPPPKPAVG